MTDLEKAFRRASVQYALIENYPNSLSVDDFNTLCRHDLIDGEVTYTHTRVTRRFKHWYGGEKEKWRLAREALIYARRNKNMSVSFDWRSHLQLTRQNTVAEIRAVGSQAFRAFQQTH